MATYEELQTLRNDPALRPRVMVAITIAAETIRTEDGGTANHTNRLVWSKAAFQNPEAALPGIFSAILAMNKSLETYQIIAADDGAIQTQVDAVVDHFATGG